MKQLQQDIHDSMWLYLYTRYQSNGWERLTFLIIAFIYIAFLMLQSDLTERELGLSTMAIGVPMIVYAFILIPIHIKTGKEIKRLSEEHSLTQQQVKNEIKNVFR